MLNIKQFFPDFCKNILIVITNKCLKCFFKGERGGSVEFLHSRNFLRAVKQGLNTTLLLTDFSQVDVYSFGVLLCEMCIRQ